MLCINHSAFPEFLFFAVYVLLIRTLHRSIIMPPVTRFAAFKFKHGVDDKQKRKALDGLLKMYEANAQRLESGPRGGTDCSPEGHGRGFEFGFLVVFKVLLLRFTTKMSLVV